MLLAVLGGSALSVSMTPPGATGGGTSGGHVGNITAIGAGGGGGGYTYAWTVTTQDPDYSLTINSPAAATTDFDFDPVGPGAIATATIRVTVTSGLETAFAENVVRFRNTLTP